MVGNVEGGVAFAMGKIRWNRENTRILGTDPLRSMLIFYSEAQGRPNVSSKAPIEEPMVTVLQIFKSLDIRRGFLSVILEPSLVLQLLPEKGGMVKIELLDRSKPAFDWCVVDSDFAKTLIELAGNGQDVFRIARKTVSKWEHTDLRWVE